MNDVNDMNEEVSEKDLEMWLRQYLDETFGGIFNGFVTPPEGAKYGERLIYKYKSGLSAKRIQTTQADLDAFQATMDDIAAKFDGCSTQVQPAGDSGLPFPRFVDLPDKSIFWPKGSEAYSKSEDLLPAVDFDLEWVFGLMFSSSKELYYLDFTHPKVKGVFSFEYEREFAIPMHVAAEKRFKEFITALDAYKKISNDFDPFTWAKIIQQDSTLTITTY